MRWRGRCRGSPVHREHPRALPWADGRRHRVGPVTGTLRGQGRAEHKGDCASTTPWRTGSGPSTTASGRRPERASTFPASPFLASWARASIRSRGATSPRRHGIRLFGMPWDYSGNHPERKTVKTRRAPSSRTVAERPHTAGGPPLLWCPCLF